MTYRPKSDFLNILQARGFFENCTDLQGLDEALIKGVVPAYIGYDATAKSLHVGHLLNIMVLRWFQKCGHKPITLMGGGTTKVGDPSFRSDERPLLDDAAIASNIDGMKQVFAKYLSYASERELKVESTLSLLRSYLYKDKDRTFYNESHILLNQLSMENFAALYSKAKGWKRVGQKRSVEIQEARNVLKAHSSGSDWTSTNAIMLNNAEWLDGLNYLDFLRDVGRHFSVNRMLSFESVKSRLDREQSLSFLEFNYMILQAYDFVEIHRRYGCLLQMGGSDQWGNIVNGIDLARRIADAEIFGLTTPLLATSDGRKMGKSQGGAIWLNADMLSPYEFWQFWRNTTDADVGRFLKLYTEMPVEECNRLGALEGSEINTAKVILANEVTTLCHGADAARTAEATARDVFEKGGIGDDLPTLSLSAAELADGMSMAQLFVRSGLAKSGKDAKRLILEGGARANDALVSDAGQMVSAADLAQPMKLTAGKKRHAQVVLDGQAS